MLETVCELCKSSALVSICSNFSRIDSLVLKAIIVSLMTWARSLPSEDVGFCRFADEGAVVAAASVYACTRYVCTAL